MGNPSTRLTIVVKSMACQFELSLLIEKKAVELVYNLLCIVNAVSGFRVSY